jgi:hypothetical protein
MGARLLLCLLLAGCASERYLSAEEDADMRKACETHGCTIVPTPLWDQLKRALGITEI